MDVAAYARQLKQLLPSGLAWNVEPTSRVSKLLLGVAEELARVDTRARNLVDEWDPRTTLELLADWERVFGLPDPCLGVAPSIPQRRASLFAKIVGIGGQTPAYYIEVAAALGYTVTLTEYDPYDVEDDVEASILGDGWAYAWQINAPLETVGEMTVDDTADEILAWWGNAALECVMLALKPAHTHLFFSYT